MKTLFVMLFVALILMPIGLSAQTYDWSWASVAGGSDADEGRAIAVDNYGNSYVTGYFRGTGIFGDYTITTTALWDIFVAKADMDGNWLWAKKVDGTATNQGWGIAVDGASNVYVAGYFANTATFGSTTLTSFGSNDVFVTKLDSNGNWQWARQAGGIGTDESFDLAIDADSNVYLTGQFNATATFGTTSITSSGLDDIFISKLDSNGNWLWAKRAGGAQGDLGMSVSTDVNGNVYVTGWFGNYANFGPTSLTSYGEHDAYIAKLDSNGNWLWAIKAGGSSGDYGYDVAVDSSANVYLTGMFAGTALFGTNSFISNGGNDGFVAKLDSAGNWLWIVQIGSTGNDELKAIKVDNSDNVYINGYISGSIYFGSEDIAGRYIAKLDNEGNILWGSSLGGNAGGGDMDVDSYSSIYVTSCFFEPTSLGDFDLISHGGADIFVAKLSPLPFYEIDVNLIGVSYGSSAWGDYDKDGDLDILITGSLLSSSGPSYVIKLYRNDGEGVFNDTNIELISVSNSSVAWGDYDNDTYLDILITGFMMNGDPSSRVYHNNGNGSFTDINAGLIVGGLGSAEWGDYDNDGDLDILIAGEAPGSNYITKIYRNNGNNTFTDIAANLPGVYHGSASWGDYDNDKDLDILVSGSCNGTASQIITKVYRNNGNDVFTDINAALINVYSSKVDWGDYDNDGDLDILLSGLSNNGGPETRYSVSRVYRNDGNGVFTDINANLISVFFGGVAWGDYDNDGDLDILITGQEDNSQQYYYTRIYRNEGDDTFVEINTGLLGMSASSIAWGDCDNDGDLDILITGNSYDGSYPFNLHINAKIYINNISSPNTIPSAPTNLRASTVGDYINFEWDAATDAQTPTLGLNYVLRVGTTPGGDDISSPMSLNSGLRLLPEMGYANSSCSWKIRSTALPQSADCYWSVQAIDTAFSGSVFATESIFLPEPILEITPIASISFPDTYLGYYSDVSELWIQNTGRAVLTLDSFSFMMTNSPFQVIEPISPVQITAGDSVGIHLCFTPQTAGNVSDSLFIYNNSLNMPIARIHLSGRGVIVPPKPPVNLQITIVGNDAVISWDAVTQTIFDTPISPDYYFVYNANKPEGEFVLNGLTPNLSYTHPYIALGAQRMFYKVTAVKLYRDDLSPSELDSYLRNNITPGMKEADVRALLNEVN